MPSNPMRLSGMDSDEPVSRPVREPVSERGELMLYGKPAPTGQPTGRSADRKLPEGVSSFRELMPNG